MATQVVDKLDSTQLGDLVDYWPGALLTGLLIGLYWSTVPGMVVDWWTYDGYSYGFGNIEPFSSEGNPKSQGYC